MLGMDLLRECFVNNNDDFINKRFYDKKHNVYKLCYNNEIPLVLKNDENILNYKIIDFLNKELKKEKQEIEMEWYKCIGEWAKNSRKYYIKICLDTDHEPLIYSKDRENFLEEFSTGYGISDELIYDGKWYLCER